ncbi:hypothetical protein [Streptosporangium canum]|uniref:hypothetical protein n=1 Tax=Streptosporangium canum TaxID=324952 RepID=UPI0037B734CC
MNAKYPTAKPPGLGLWWTILILGSVISAFLNIWHALHQDGQGTAVILGLIFAAVPVGFAAMLSHGLVSPAVEKWFRYSILGLFAVSMLTSIASQAAVMRPYGGGYGAEWSIPLVLDASSLLALHYITKAHKMRREVARQADIERDMDAIRARLRPDIERDIRATLEADMAAQKADMEADMAVRLADMEHDMAARKADMERDISATREADIAAAVAAKEGDLRDTMAAELSAARAALEADKDAWIAENEMSIWTRAEVETEARVRRELAASNKPQSHRKTVAAAPAKPTEEALTSKKKALILLEKNPDMTGAELGRALGKSDRTGQRLLDEINAERDAAAAAGSRLRAVN